MQYLVAVFIHCSFYSITRAQSEEAERQFWCASFRITFVLSSRKASAVLVLSPDLEMLFLGFL